MKMQQLVINPGWEQFHLIETLSRRGPVEFLCEIDHSIDPLLLDLMGNEIPTVRFFDELDRDTWPQTDADYFSSQSDRSLYLESKLQSKFCSNPRTPIYRGLFSNRKNLVRDILADESISQPRYLVRPTLKQLVEFIKICESVVIKPIDSCGSMGVSFVDLASTENEIMTACKIASQNSLSSTFMIEQRVFGTHFIVESLGASPILIGQKAMSEEAPSLAEIIDFVSPLNEDIVLSDAQAAVSETHKRICNALGYRSGHASGEYIVDKFGSVHLIEIAGRGGGVWISSLVSSKLTGIDVNLWLVATEVNHDRLSNISSPEFQGARLEYIFANSDTKRQIGVNWAPHSVELIWQSDSHHKDLTLDARDRIGMRINWMR